MVTQCNESVRKPWRKKYNAMASEARKKKARNPGNSHPGQLSIFHTKIRKFPRKYFLLWAKRRKGK